MVNKNVIGLILKSDIHQATKFGYEEAMDALKLLQSNASYLKNAAQQGPVYVPHDNKIAARMEDVKMYLMRSGFSLEQMDKLSVIHVAGTKGKGSTCAYCESILREYGYRTGLFTSPHLIEVRERIRINGAPLDKDAFAKYFWPVYNKLDSKKKNPADMPMYFRFLTIMAFHVFLQEKVDVAIIEVGIGGEYDCTNILRKVLVAGITSLGIDHVSVLGDTLEKIAWQKAGIMKEGAKVFTVPQPKEALNVLKERSIIRKCDLTVVPPLNDYDLNEKFQLNDTQKINIALAIQLSHCWMKLQGNNKNENELQMHENGKSGSSIKFHEIPNETINGIKKCSWPGRLQIIKKDHITFYLDGAHTVESLTNCMDWFKENTKNSLAKKALLYYVTGDRDFESLIKIAQSCTYDYICFTPTISVSKKILVTQNNIPSSDFNKKCEILRESWIKHRSLSPSHPAEQLPLTFTSVEEALNVLPRNKNLNVLVTGSLHLVGTVLELIDPDLRSSNAIVPKNLPATLQKVCSNTYK